MLNIVGISGSLRKGSYNTALMHAAKELLPNTANLEILSIANIPLYNGDVEAKGMPSEVVALKDKVAKADAILISTPEYNNSIPGVLKNALDWISRPNSDLPRVFHNKPFGLIGVTPGGWGTLNAQTAWLPIIRYFKLRPCFANSVYISAAQNKFDADLKLIDQATIDLLKKFLTDYVEFISFPL